MIVKFIEAVENQEINWGKFMLCRFTSQEWQYQSEVDHFGLLRGRGWTPLDHLLIVDLQTGEGAVFKPGGLAAADLDKHRIWVCPLFEPFLAWLYQQDLRDLAALPALVNLGDVPAGIAGHRRAGGAAR